MTETISQLSPRRIIKIIENKNYSENMSFQNVDIKSDKNASYYLISVFSFII